MKENRSYLIAVAVLVIALLLLLLTTVVGRAQESADLYVGEMACHAWEAEDGTGARYVELQVEVAALLMEGQPEPVYRLTLLLVPHRKDSFGARPAWEGVLTGTMVATPSVPLLSFMSEADSVFLGARILPDDNTPNRTQLNDTGWVLCNLDPEGG
jgi:hypothetical protein